MWWTWDLTTWTTKRGRLMKKVYTSPKWLMEAKVLPRLCPACGSCVKALSYDYSIPWQKRSPHATCAECGEVLEYRNDHPA